MIKILPAKYLFVLLILISIFGEKNVWAQKSVTFDPPVQSGSLGASPIKMVSGYVDGDKIKDIVITCEDQYVYVLIGKGDGSFASAKKYLIGGSTTYSHGIGIADFNKDTFLDLAVVTDANAGDSISVLINSGTGTFPTHVQYFLGGMVNDLTIADFDQDGYMDIAASTTDPLDLLYNELAVFINKKNGTFKNEVIYDASTNIFNHYISSGNFNSDNYPDIALPLDKSDSIVVYINNGDGTFPDSVKYKTVLGPSTPIILDLDLDGNKDLISSGLNNSSAAMAFLFNKGSGKDSLVIHSLDNDPNLSSGTVVADFNNDLIPDFAATVSGSNSPDTVLVYINSGNLKLGPPIKIPVLLYSYFMITDDFNNDQLQDIAVLNAGDNTFQIILQNKTTVAVIPSLSQETQLNIYPNPATTVLNIEFLDLSESMSFTLYDAIGRPVKYFEKPIHTKIELDITDLQKGLYWLKPVSGSSGYQLVKE